MNQSRKQFVPTGAPTLDPIWLDRLVDDELDDAQRRELLALMTRDSDGWRRCALAFLESQSLGRELKSLRHSTSPGGVGPDQRIGACQKAMLPTEVGAADNPRKSESWARQVVSAHNTNPSRGTHDATSTSRQPGPVRRRPWSTYLAMAASFLLVFSFGLYFRGILSPERRDPVTNRTRQPTPNWPTQDRLSRETEIANAKAGKSRARVGRRQDGKWGDLRVVVGHDVDGKPRLIEVPIWNEDDINPDWFASQGRAVPPDVRRYLEQEGNEVRETRDWIPFDLEDGRQVIVPVDEVNIVPVSRRSYQ